jgi:hypothetical protein
LHHQLICFSPQAVCSLIHSTNIYVYMHINSNQVNVHSSRVASYRKKRERERENIRRQRKRGGERWRRMLAIICIAPSRQVWGVWGIELMLLPLRHTIIIIIQTVVMYTRVRNWWTNERNSFEITALSSLYIREECIFFPFLGYQ